MNEDIEYFTESTKKGNKSIKEYFLEGTIMQSNLKNKNGRVYPKDVLFKQTEQYVKEFVEKRRAFGELGHPSNPSLNLDKTCHLFEKLETNGNNIVGRAKVLNTPKGKIVKAMMDEKCLLGISSRGLGSIKDKGQIKEVQSDFRLITAGDLVHDPSAPEAFLANIMENADWVYELGEWKLIQDTKDSLHEQYKSSMTREEKGKLFLEKFEKFLQEISK